jgi:hypothetical protein
MIIAFWKDFLDTLNTPGGHILILLCIIAGCAVAQLHVQHPSAEKLLEAASAILFYAMRGDRTANGDARTKLQRSTDKEQVLHKVEIKETQEPAPR